ncbi:probable xyloglucan endotransglucosylase/hydrolase protein 30 [Zingiber officinale]|uniref:probable xyloglucan endotransglucosylase/hydrolase protein 30 n=1 Tax=Zingiber officinale TaxID=94328 RepID=UPI001C4C306E|nr:probable xyloglucan endotransglucosylase/hydrolase protein 30 [Zingiber officinale]
MDRRKLVLFLSLCLLVSVAVAFNVSTLTFDEGFTPLFGDERLVRSADGRRVRLHLDQYSGSGFISSSMYQYGLFSALMKLPADYTAGVVIAFYTSNGDVFERTHDELDFEFLGNVQGKEWRVQTNVYGNGSTSRGREERYFLPFDPTAGFHRYSIVWIDRNIIFYVDDVPIREVRRSEAMGGDYPSKPMSLYATIWDASSWATAGGTYKVDYAYAPFVAEYDGLALLGCRADPLREAPFDDDSCDDDDHATLAATGLGDMTADRLRSMLAFRERYMTYSFCYDALRYPTPFPDCRVVESERARFRETGHARPRPAPVQAQRRRVRRRRGGARAAAQY